MEPSMGLWFGEKSGRGLLEDFLQLLCRSLVIEGA